MAEDYERAKRVIKTAVSRGLASQVDDFVRRCEKAFKKIVKLGHSKELDLTKLLSVLKGLHIVKSRKHKKAKRLALTLIIAAMTALSMGYLIKNYMSITEGSTVEEKMKIFLENLKLEKLKNNPTIKRIRHEIKRLMEQEG